MKNKIKCLLSLNIIFVLINLTVFAATSDLVDDEYFMLSMEDLYGSRYTMPQVGDNTENVNKNDGAFEVREMDIVIEGQNGFNLPVIRCFNSDASTGSLDGRDLNNASVQKTGVAYPYSYEIDGVEKIRYVGFYDLDEAANAPYSFMGRNVSNDSYSETYSDETNPQSGYFYKMYSVLTNEAYTLNTEYTLVENAQKRWIYDKVSMYYRNPDNVAETSVNLKNGWTISVPTISVDQYELTNVARKSRGVFRDIYGNAYPYFAYTTEYNDNQAVNFGFKTLQQDYYEEFVNEDNVRETLTFNGKAYNLKVIGKDGITYYFNHTFLSNTNGKFIGMSDRYGNKITYAKSTSSADGITYHTYTDSYNNKIKISQNGVMYNGKELIRYTQAIENDSSEEIDEGNNEYIFKVYKKEGDEDILSSENVTEYYSKRRPSLSGLPRILSYDMFLPHKVVYPSGAEAYYEYGYYDSYKYYTNSIGPETIKKFYVNKSYDKAIDGSIKNSYEYTFSFANRTLATAKYTNTVTDTINNSTKSLQFNRVGQLINETKKKNSNNFICEIIDYEYDAEKIGGKVTSINTRERTSSTKYADVLTTYTYDSNYNMKKEENGDYCVNYTYDTDYYNLPLTTTYKKDADTEILIVNTLSEDHKSIVCEKTYVNSEAKQAQHYTYDTYGNITKIETVTGCNCDDNTVTPNVQVLRTIEYSYTFPTSSDNHKTITTTVKNLYDADSVLLGDVVTTKKYDYLGNIVSSTDALGNTTTFEYDNLGRTIKTTHPDNAYETVDYDTQNNTIITTDALGNKMKYVFDEWGNQTASYGFKDNSFYILESWTYDAKNRLATHIQHRTAGNITETYTYDYRSRLTSKTITNANGETESKYTYSYTYGNDSNGRGTFAIVVNTPQNNDVTPAQIVKKYDYRNNLIMDRLYVNSDNLITKTATYDYVGNMITSKDGRGYTTRYEYDYQNNLTKTILPISGYETTNTYDVLGNCISSTDAMGTTTTYTYDILNRLIKAETPLNENENMLTKTYYDKNGNTIKTMIKSGDNSFDTTEYAYDTRNRLKYVKTNPTAETSDYTRYFYDLNGNVTSYITGLSDPDVIPMDCSRVDYTYNHLNLLEEENRPYSEPMFYEYDNAGNVSYIYDRNGNEYSMAYNANNSILSRVGEDIDEEYRYDYWGNVVYAQNDYGTTTYTYDVFGRLTSETNNGIMKAYTYNKNNDVLTFKIYENDELIHSESNSYDALGRVTTSTINGKTATYTYDKNGNVTAYSFDGNDYTYTYNKANMPTGKTSTLGQKTFGAQYLPNGNISVLTETGAPNISYTYDGAGRLTNETKTGVSSVTYGYDARGNRTSKVYNDLVNNTSETTTYEYPTYNSNLQTIKVNGVASEHFGYDNNGNLIRKFNGNYQITDNYTYDVLNRLTHSASNGVTTSYTYDTNNLRQTKTMEISTQPTDAVSAVSALSFATNETAEIDLASESAVSIAALSQIDNTAGITASVTNSGRNITVTGNVSTGKGRMISICVTDEDGNVVYVNQTESATDGNFEKSFPLTKQAKKGIYTVKIGTYGVDEIAEISFMYGEDIVDVTASVTNEGRYVTVKGSISTGKSKPITILVSDEDGEVAYLNQINSESDGSFEKTFPLTRTAKKGTYRVDMGTEGVYETAVLSFNYEEETPEFINRTVRHIYNGQNVVMDKFANGVTHSYVKNAVGEMSAVKICDPTNTETPEYYDYYITNIHNDVVGTSNGKTYSYDAFGNQQSIDATDNNPFRYTGEYYDHETDLVYLRNRYYDPSIGRFVTEDPIKDGLNWYAYCGNNPVNFVDPLGLAPSVMEAALMAEHVYDYDMSNDEYQRTVSNWRMITVWEGREGMKMGFYIPSSDDWQNPSEYVIAFKGTTMTDLSDWKNNAEQLLSPKSADMWDAINYSIGFVNSKTDYEITFVGHSKGGAEAASAAVATNRNAMIFNPATSNLSDYGLSASTYTADMTAFIVKGDIVNYFEGWFSAPIDKAKYLPQQYGGHWYEGWKTNNVQRIQNHLMPAVKNALKKEGY